jgi:U3 small nucleolar RNA-associated protein 22
VTRPLQSVDLAVRIPKACFHEKDFLNHRYYAKRILFLAHLERKLKKCAAISKIEWSTFSYDSRKPVLVLRLGPDDSGALTKFSICIIPCIASDVFDSAKLSLARNNVRECKDKGEDDKYTCIARHLDRNSCGAILLRWA